MHRNLQRANVLFEQGRMQEAADEIRRALLDDPNDAVAHAMLAFCWLDAKKYDEASAEAELAIHFAPSDPYVHYVHAAVLRGRNRFKEALLAIEEAIALEPFDADARALQSSIFFDLRDWQRALDSANAGLAIDPENINCSNLRAQALIKLGRKAEAAQTTDSVLARQPENAVSHATRGWTCLERGEPKQAMVHFREALRLEPNLEYARRGIVEALKARNPIYRWMLGYFLWMDKLSDRARWGVIIGGYVGYQFARQAADANPTLGMILWPLIGLYIAFVVMTWIAVPLFNLFLRLHPFGRLALSREEIIASNWAGGLVLISLVAWGLVFGGWREFIVVGFTSALMLMPVSSVFQMDEGWPRRMMGWFAVLLGFLAAVLIYTIFTLPDDTAPLGIFGEIALYGFIGGMFLIPWVANYLNRVVAQR